MTIMMILAHITIGLFIGWMSYEVVGDRGVNLIYSLIFGVLGAVIGLAIVQIFNLAGSAIYAAFGGMGILFIVNVFRQEEPIFKNTEIS